MTQVTITGGAKAARQPQLQYLTIRDHIAARIESGGFPPGSKLPSERQLQHGEGIARGTIREALFQLESEGLIYRKDRSGWYVSPPRVVYDPTSPQGFMAYVSEQGRVPETITISKEEIRATQWVAEALRIRVGAPAFFIRRRRLIDGRAVLVEHISVNPKLAPGLIAHSLDVSLTGVLREHYGVVVARNEIAMYPCALTKTQAEELRVKSGTPGLHIVRTSFDREGRVVEYDQEFWRHDALKVRFDVRVK